MPVLFAQGVVVKARQLVDFLDRTTEILCEPSLGSLMDHPIRPRNQHLRRHGDGSGIGHHTLGRLIQTQQDVRGDRTGDQGIRLIAGNPGRVVRQEPGLDIAVDEKRTHDLLPRANPHSCERDVQLDLKGRRRQGHASDGWGVVMHPR